MLVESCFPNWTLHSICLSFFQMCFFGSNSMSNSISVCDANSSFDASCFGWWSIHFVIFLLRFFFLRIALAILVIVCALTADVVALPLRTLVFRVSRHPPAPVSLLPLFKRFITFACSRHFERMVVPLFYVGCVCCVAYAAFNDACRVCQALKFGDNRDLALIKKVDGRTCELGKCCTPRLDFSI